MTEAIRQATARERALVWPAVRADRLMRSPDELAGYLEAAPWALRVTDRGDAALLGRWKAHLDVLAIRGLWCAETRVGDFVSDAVAVASEQGLASVLSPLVPESLLAPYLAAGMRVRERIVAVQGAPGDVAAVPVPDDVCIREGSAADTTALARLDAECFDDFWRWTEPDLIAFLAHERLALAETAGGTLIGYTMTTVSRGAATLTRLATTPAYRRRGIGRALLAEAAQWARDADASTLSLCTQASNRASRALYEAAGLREVEEAYAFASREVDGGGEGA